MSIELLLSKVSQISQKHELINQKTGVFFNIFDIANISTDEVTVCRFIYELINPRGSHFQGNTYLRLFVENVLKMKFSELDYKTAKVHREYVISGNRRIDLVIETKDKFIPIEVKIYAGDQNKQCFDYYQYAKASNVYYLTLNGNSPSSHSAKGLTPIYEDAKTVIGYEEVTQISFENDILIWLNKCISSPETIKIAPIREILIQFMGAIRNMTSLLLEEKENEIVETIVSSKENMRSAIEIEKSLKACKIEMLKKVFVSIEERLNNKFIYEQGLEKHSYKDINYKLINTYYNQNKSTYPGISYHVKALDKKDVDLWLRIEIENHIFVGLCTTENKEWKGTLLDIEEFKLLLNDKNPCLNGWWIYRDYLPNGSKGNSPNFKEFNEEYFDLFEENKFEEFINSCETSILKVLDKLR